MIQVEHPMQVRQAMAVRMALRTLLPWLVAMPILGGLLWWRIGHSLQPLTAVARAERPHLTRWICSRSRGCRRSSAPGHGLKQSLTALSRGARRRGEFIADAAHALRTPLAAVHLQAHLVTQAGEEAERGEAIAAQRGIERASNLVQELLTLARVERGRPRTPAPCGAQSHRPCSHRRPCCPGRRKRD